MAKSKILNFSTEVPVSRSIGQVHAILVEAGARQIMTTYDNVGTPLGVSFAIETPEGGRALKLPVNADRVHKVINRYDSGVPPRYRNRDQADRIAWRIAKDWLEAQLAIVQTEMVTFEQVMLPYMRTEDGRTMYELYVEGQAGVPALMPASE